MKLTPEYVRDTLLKLGFMPANSGFHYIVDAMMIIDSKPYAAYNAGKMIYMPISERNNCNYNSVERSIRHSIKTAMDKNYDGIVKYLRFPPNSATGSYKNADFLAAFHMALHRS